MLRVAKLEGIEAERGCIEELRQIDDRYPYLVDATSGEGERSAETNVGSGIQEILDALPFYVLLVDETHHIVLANKAVRRHLGLDPEKIVGGYCPKVVHGLDGPFPGCPLEEAVEKGYAIEQELFDTHSGRWFASAIYPISHWTQDGRAIFFHMLRDITERKRTERLLQALNQAAIAMEKALTPEKIFTAVAEELKKLGFVYVVLLTDEGQSRLFLKYFSYEAGAIKAAEKLVGLKAEDLPIPVETVDVYRNVVWERKAILVENVEEVVRQLLPGPIKRFAKQITKLLKVANSIAAPLIVEDKVLGVFSVQSNDLTEDDVPAITAFAHQMAAAWRKARLIQELEQSLTERTRAGEELQQSFKQ